MPGLPEKKKILITVRTYPVPARTGIEVSCTGGITADGKWIRLFPMPYRFLRPDQQFRKYQWIEASVTRASDSRPESYHIIRDTIKIVSDMIPTKNEWQAERDKNKFPTLGIFKPKSIEKLEIEPDSPNWSQAELEKLKQADLLDNAPAEELEKIPYKFRYYFKCDEARCSGHTAICTDWEMSQSYRKWRRDYGDGWESKFRQKYESEMIGRYDTHFYVGTVNAHPSAWIVVGLFYPPVAKSDPNYSLFS
jgi:hypothetical protein